MVILILVQFGNLAATEDPVSYTHLRIKKVPVKITVLDNGSHFPIEETALEQLHNNILQFIKENLHLE